MDQRVVITGMGSVSPLGMSQASFWAALVNGVGAVQQVARFAETAAGYRTHIAAEIPNFSAAPFLTEKESSRLSRFSQMAVVASKMAMMDAHLILNESNQRHMGVILGTGIGGIEVIEKQHRDLLEKGAGKINPFAAAAIVPHAASTEVSIMLGIKGPNMTVSTGCSAGLNAIGMAYDAIRSGRAEMMLTGGVEAPLSHLTFATFDATREMSTQNDNALTAVKPFDANRDGYVLSEGAALMVIERLEHAQKRGAHIYGEIVGFGSTGDAYHSYKLDPQGNSVVVAMDMALHEAKLAAEEVDWILAHGSGSKGGDQKEGAAILKVFKDYAAKVPVTAIKATMGMPFGASGAFQLQTALLGFENAQIPQTLNYKTPDPQCPLNVIAGESRSMHVETALMTSFGLGGNNSVMIVKKFGE
jgi:3-oxoacyl-[acyl-carrier-protein] synthase II